MSDSNSPKKEIKVGTRIRVTGLPPGEGYPKSLIGRTGTVYAVDTAIAKTCYVTLDPHPRERTQKKIGPLSQYVIED